MPVITIEQFVTHRYRTEPESYGALLPAMPTELFGHVFAWRYRPGPAKSFISNPPEDLYIDGSLAGTLVLRGMEIDLYNLSNGWQQYIEPEVAKELGGDGATRDTCLARQALQNYFLAADYVSATK